MLAFLKTLQYLGICLSALVAITIEKNSVPRADNVHWVSLDFKTILTWTIKASNYTYTVLYSEDDRDWEENPDCIRLREPECDLTNYLEAFDRVYSADIRTEPVTMDYDDILEELPHTYSPPFNPYRESNISAVKFTVAFADESSVIVNITEPLTGIHRQGKQLSIRDILKNDLKYKISYYKSGSSGKRDIISDSSLAEVSKLEAGDGYCFMVAAFIPSRPKNTQHGAWSVQLCANRGSNVLQELNLGAWVGVVFTLIVVLVITVTVTVLCCRCYQQRQSTHTSQTSAPI
ncbi:tissue factor-like isoform X1 [Antennarius striatus]|uniref:tissue factor-like isoform X1 n=1 Tax=Antennarius striatus TaxID=241820 RepID=UPI0035AE394C